MVSTVAQRRLAADASLSTTTANRRRPWEASVLVTPPTQGGPVGRGQYIRLFRPGAHGRRHFSLQLARPLSFARPITATERGSSTGAPLDMQTHPRLPN